MIFYTKLAKLGKADGVTCKQVDDNLFNLYISSGNVIKKQLTEAHKQYTLSKNLQTYAYSQIVEIGGGYLLARIENLVSILKE